MGVVSARRASAGQSEVGHVEVLCQVRNGFGPDEVVETLAGEGDMVGGHGGE